MYFRQRRFLSNGGFTLIELLVVIAIVGILASVVSMSLSDSQLKSRDASRKVQIQEILKALELFYSENGVYPEDATPADTSLGGTFTDIGSSFIGSTYLRQTPSESDRYQYCASSDRKSIILALDTEEDRGGSNYCGVTRGTGSGIDGYGCTNWVTSNATDLCFARF